MSRARLGQEGARFGPVAEPGATAAGDAQVAEDEAGAIAQALEDSPVYFGPGTESWMTPGDVEALTAAIEENELSFYVVLVRPPDGTSNSGGDLVTRVKQAREAAELPAQGLYVGVDYARPRDGSAPASVYTDDTTLRVTVQPFGEVSPRLVGRADRDSLTLSVDLFLGYGAGDGTPYELGPGLVELAERLNPDDVASIRADGSAGLEAKTEQRAESGTGSSSGSGQSGSPGVPGGDGFPTVPVVSGVVALVVLVVAVVTASRRRTSASRDRRTFALPDSVLSRVREAEADELRRRARAALVTLGEKIEGAQVGPRDDTATWQAALDHYEAAGRLLPDDGTTPSVLDAVGAIVLVDRGEQAMAATRRRTKLVFTRPCFLNPLHGVGRRGESLAHGDFRVDAPVCDRCRADLKAGRRPDILDVVEDGKPEHYFETRHEPWASTGYGALEPDLLRRLRTCR
ncbi:hypothetical protein GCM10027215_22580 [Nocardioides zeae]